MGTPVPNCPVASDLWIHGPGWIIAKYGSLQNWVAAIVQCSAQQSLSNIGIGNSPGTTTPPAAPKAGPVAQWSAYQIIAAWLLVLLVLTGIAHTQIGSRIVYGILLLAIVFLVLTQHEKIVLLLKPIGTPPS